MAIDERSAAFFALGMAKAMGRPVALACTSGTAVANYLPAVVEASHAHVPLILLTADRPPELRDTGAAQTIDQRGIYGSFTRWAAELNGDLPGAEGIHFARRTASRAVCAALGPAAGPVHLNLPLRDPLLPDGPLGAVQSQEHSPYTESPRPRRLPAREALESAISAISAAGRIAVVAGPDTGPWSLRLSELAGRLGAPLLADPLSGQRRQGAASAYDALLRDSAVANALIPDLVLRLGGPPVSKPLTRWLSLKSHRQIVISAQSPWQDPLPVPTLHLHGDVEETLEVLLDLLPTAPRQGDYRHIWSLLDTAAREAMDGFLDQLPEPFEGEALRSAARALGEDDLLYVGNSMPVRDLDSFSSAISARVLCNRGANGIDGVVSSALGAAVATSGRTLLAIGDLSFHHDLGGLLLSRTHAIDLTVLLLNNDGGGIFSFLPQSGHERFEELFGTPHGLDFSHVAALYGGRLLRPGPGEDRAAIAAALRTPGLSLVEVRTDRTRNVRLHEAALSVAMEAARAVLSEVARA